MPVTTTSEQPAGTAQAGPWSARLRQHWPALAGGALVWLLASLRVVVIARADGDLWAQAVPDDAFYYAQLARNAVHLHAWTYDGTAPTTGFHVLYGYALAALTSVTGGLDGPGLLLVVGLVAALGLGIAAALTASAAQRLLGVRSVPLSVALLAAPMGVMQASLLMETWAACLLGALALVLVTRDRAARPAALAGLVSLGTVGSLVRSDFGLLPAGLLLGALMASSGSARRWGAARAGAVTGGAAVGVGLVSLHTWAVSGSFVQASVRVKLLWRSVSGTTPAESLQGPLALVTRTFTQVPPSGPRTAAALVAWALVVALVGIGAIALVRRAVRVGSVPRAALAPVVGAVLAVGGYLLLWSRDGEVQLWYVGLLLVPCSLVLAAVGAAGLRGRVLVPGVVVVAVATGLTLVSLMVVPYPAQAQLLELGRAVHDLPPDRTVGSWNAGLIGFVADRGVVNLDGLVDDDAVPWIERGSLADYVRLRGITDLADYRKTLLLPGYPARGGYADGRLVRCLERPVVTFPDSRGLADLDASLWPLRPGCL